MTILSKNNQSGRSMVEMLGVLAIIGVLSVGGISGYSKAMAKFKLTKAQDQITMLLMNIRTAYATSPSYAGLDSKTAGEYNLAPGDMVSGSDSNTKLYGAFGGEVTVEACSSSNICSGSAATGNTYFGIQMKNLGDEACRSLATSDWGADGLVEIKVGTTRTTTEDLPLSLQTAAGLCKNGSTDITWIYY